MDFPHELARQAWLQNKDLIHTFNSTLPKMRKKKNKSNTIDILNDRVAYLTRCPSTILE